VQDETASPEDGSDTEIQVIDGDEVSTVEEEPFTPARLRKEIKGWDSDYVARYRDNLKNIKRQLKNQTQAVNDILEIVLAEQRRRKQNVEL
jgi:hypothetical protein